MRRCYHCRTRAVYQDDDGPACLACGRLQVSPAWMPKPMTDDAPALRPSYPYTCRQCGIVQQADCRAEAMRRQFCSRSCKTRAQMRAQKQRKRWCELQIA